LEWDILVVAACPGEGPFAIRFADPRHGVLPTASSRRASRPTQPLAATVNHVATPRATSFWIRRLA
jgi:hypothetical protein